MPVSPQPIESEHRQHRGDKDSKRLHRDDHLRQTDTQQDNAHSHRVTESNWGQCTPDTTCMALLHAERDREQPSHAGVDAVIRAEKHHRVPVHDSSS
jgi:hypothetical protein